MPRFEPPANELSQPFWEATREGRFLLQWCAACDAPVYYPRYHCPACLGDDLHWREADGRGSVYTFNVMHSPASPLMADRVPYVLALIDLVEGARVLSNIVNCAPSDVRVGMAVKLTWEDLSDGRRLAVFEPA